MTHEFQVLLQICNQKRKDFDDGTFHLDDRSGYFQMNYPKIDVKEHRKYRFRGITTLDLIYSRSAQTFFLMHTFIIFRSVIISQVIVWMISSSHSHIDQYIHTLFFQVSAKSNIICKMILTNSNLFGYLSSAIVSPTIVIFPTTITTQIQEMNTGYVFRDQHLSKVRK